MTAMTSIPASRMTRHEWLTEVFQSQLLKGDLKTKLPRGISMLRICSHTEPVLEGFDLRSSRCTLAQAILYFSCVACVMSTSLQTAKWGAASAFLHEEASHLHSISDNEPCNCLSTEACAFSSQFIGLAKVNMAMPCRLFYARRFYKCAGHVEHDHKHLESQCSGAMADKALPASLPTLARERWSTILASSCGARYHLRSHLPMHI